MPRAVDHVQRKRDIVDAVWRVAADDGPHAVTFRRIAKELGGSTTIVTEAFSTRAELLDYAVTTKIADWQRIFYESVAVESDPVVTLRATLVESCPVDEAALRESRAWLVALPLSTAVVGQRMSEISAAYTRWLSGQLVTLLERTGTPTEVVDQLLVTVYGITVAAVEDPTAWPRERIEALIDRTLASIGITVG
ncbi:TetR family transcriptional regulator [Nocardia sp. SYP-A9097]|uniref:TetR/AcrR family transcriptional regulator n=1 Tax=Nocardia sp. SYP-A9097 TaxID=2663237 RepID=UPI00129BEBE3|nr:TetR family transcriptional regulator C-terminal domain-containing protein [Nocardia sp. SYP-A9097]MRH90743.1 TetR family transcriptional regulator [Nocardia sp. SYP-A9097]